MAEKVVVALKKQFGGAIIESASFRGDETVLVQTDKITEICSWLKSAPEMDFNFMSDICGADYPERNDRLEVIYHLYSIKFKHRIRLKVRVTAENPEVPTVTGVWVGANWFEREAFDLFGVKFTGHPNLKRILTFPEFAGHPLRKDYPLNKRPRIPTPDSMLD